MNGFFTKCRKLNINKSENCKTMIAIKQVIVPTVRKTSLNYNMKLKHRNEYDEKNKIMYVYIPKQFDKLLSKNDINREKNKDAVLFIAKVLQMRYGKRINSEQVSSCNSIKIINLKPIRHNNSIFEEFKQFKSNNMHIFNLKHGLLCLTPELILNKNFKNSSIIKETKAKLIHNIKTSNLIPYEPKVELINDKAKLIHNIKTSNLLPYEPKVELINDVKISNLIPYDNNLKRLTSAESFTSKRFNMIISQDQKHVHRERLSSHISINKDRLLATIDEREIDLASIITDKLWNAFEFTPIRPKPSLDFTNREIVDDTELLSDQFHRIESQIIDDLIIPRCFSRNDTLNFMTNYAFSFSYDENSILSNIKNRPNPTIFVNVELDNAYNDSYEDIAVNEDIEFILSLKYTVFIIKNNRVECEKRFSGTINIDHNIKAKEIEYFGNYGSVDGVEVENLESYNEILKMRISNKSSRESFKALSHMYTLKALMSRQSIVIKPSNISVKNSMKGHTSSTDTNEMGNFDTSEKSIF